MLSTSCIVGWWVFSFTPRNANRFGRRTVDWCQTVWGMTISFFVSLSSLWWKFLSEYQQISILQNVLLHGLIPLACKVIQPTFADSFMKEANKCGAERLSKTDANYQPKNFPLSFRLCKRPRYTRDFPETCFVKSFQIMLSKQDHFYAWFSLGRLKQCMQYCSFSN